MKVRPALRSDFDGIAEVGSKANCDDPIEAWHYPYRNRHPKAFKRAFYNSARDYAREPRCFIIVAETEPTDSYWAGKPQIAGFCFWIRKTKNKEMKLKWGKKENIAQRLFRKLWNSTFSFYVEVFFNPSGSLINALRYGQGDEVYFDPAHKEPDEYWGLNEIAVAPEFQRKGVGMKLLEWGLKLAREDKVPVTLASTDAGRRLYDKAGFVQEGTWRWNNGEGMETALMTWDLSGKDEMAT